MYCLEKGNKKKCFAQTPSLRTEKRALCKYSSVLGFAERLKNTTAEELYEKKVAYDEQCYSSLANITKVDRARNRFVDSVNNGERFAVKRKEGKPSLNGEIAPMYKSPSVNVTDLPFVTVAHYQCVALFLIP